MKKAHDIRDIDESVIEVAKLRAADNQSGEGEADEHVDFRVYRTQENFLATLEELLSEKSFEDITVNEICDRAGYRRTTFYKYYRDKQDFLVAYSKTFSKRLHRKIGKSGAKLHTAEYYAEYSRGLVEFFLENISIVSNMYGSAVLPIVMKALAREIYTDIYENLLESSANGMRLVASPEVLSAACVGTATATIYLWLSSEKKKSKDELIDDIFKTVMRCLAIE